MQTEVIKEKLEALSSAILALAESFESEETEAPKKTKAKKSKDVEETSDDDLGFGEESESEVTLDDVKKAFKDYVKTFDDIKKGRATAMKILKKLKVKTLDDLEESQYQEAIDLVS